MKNEKDLLHGKLNKTPSNEHSHLEITTLGGLSFHLNGRPVISLHSHKAEALLVYLAITSRPHSREVLASLLWDDFSQKRAMNNLRVVLSNLRKHLGDHLLITRENAAINPESDYDLDVAVLEENLNFAGEFERSTSGLNKTAIARIELAVNLYRGSFLEGFFVENALEFDAWMAVERERLHLITLDGLGKLVRWVLANGEYSLGIRYASKWVQLEPLSEAAYRQMMRLLVFIGERSAALAQYEKCREILEKELGVVPDPETTALYEQIRDGILKPDTITSQHESLLESAVQKIDSHSLTFKTRYRHNLPIQSTSFVGREDEISKIVELLDDPNCRLITLVGPGGIGKTRLALEVVARKLGNFANGVFYIPLQQLTSHEKIVPAIVNSLGLKLISDRLNPRRPLFNFLQEKSILLLMDNFEHVLEGVQIVPNLLAVAPGIKIVATSRESLNLSEEYLFNVQGLSFPGDDQTTPVEPYHAVELFEERASQVSPDFCLEDVCLDVMKICHLVVGMPLAIELAASWLKVLTCKEISQRIRLGLDALETTLRNVPERHQSMMVTFDASWRLLNITEQIAFRKLSVFKGGFTIDAGREVAGANWRILQSLVDKSLIRRNMVSGRFDIHELLRQYGEYHLNKSPEEAAAVHDQHCSYYSSLLAQNQENIQSHLQQHMIRELNPELDNIRKSWQWAIDHARVDDILKSVITYNWVHVFHSQFLDLIVALEAAIRWLDGETPDDLNRMALAVNLSMLGWIYVRIGDFELAEASLTRSRSLYQSVNEPPPPVAGAEPLTGLALLACIRGNFEEAIKLGEEACQVSQQRDDPGNLGLGQYAIISTYFHQGKYQVAQALGENWLKVLRELGGTWMMANPLNVIGNIARIQGNYHQAREYFRESYEIMQAFDDPQGMAAALNFLGMTLILEGDYDESKKCHQECYELYRQVGDRGGVGYALCGLGTTALAIGDYKEASRHFYHALEIVSTIQYMPVIFLALIGIGELLITSGQHALGIEILTLVHHHEKCGHEARDRVNTILSSVSNDLSRNAYNAAIEQGKSLVLNNVVQTLLAEYVDVKFRNS